MYIRGIVPGDPTLPPYAAGMEEHVALYDEDCGFCRWSLARLLRWDRGGRLRAVPIQSEEGARLLADLSAQERLASWHLVTPDVRRSSGGAAAGPLARLLPAGAPIAFLAETFPRSTDRLYRWVARHRDALGRWLGEQACAVDPSERTGRPTSA
jgi:predicted DCC family thiol-disulfide oxidoreductase YuxK